MTKNLHASIPERDISWKKHEARYVARGFYLRKSDNIIFDIDLARLLRSVLLRSILSTYNIRFIYLSLDARPATRGCRKSLDMLDRIEKCTFELGS